jgi:uncharacterized membrane protein (DUF4010 family)
MRSLRRPGAETPWKGRISNIWPRSVAGVVLADYRGSLRSPFHEQPFSLRAALRFGLIFLALHVGGTLAQRYLGMFGFYAVSIVGGMLSSASAVAAAGTAVVHNEIPAQIAANGAVLASLTSTLIDIPLVARIASQRSLMARLSFTLGVIAVAGIAGIVLHDLLKLQSIEGRPPDRLMPHRTFYE